jgi:hypothetical protein
VTVPEQVEAAILRVEAVLTNYTGGLSIPEAKTRIDTEVGFIEQHITFARFEVSKLRTSTETLFGLKGPRGDVDKEKYYARCECQALRVKTAQLRQLLGEQQAVHVVDLDPSGDVE